MAKVTYTMAGAPGLTPLTPECGEVAGKSNDIRYPSGCPAAVFLGGHNPDMPARPYLELHEFGWLASIAVGFLALRRGISPGLAQPLPQKLGDG